MAVKQALLPKSLCSSPVRGRSSSTTSSRWESREQRLMSARHEDATTLSRPPSTDKESRELDKNEEELESALQLTCDCPLYDQTGLRTYDKACQKVGVNPVSSCRKSLVKSETLDLQYYGLGPRGAMTVAMALLINQQISVVNLKANDLSAEGGLYIQRMMEDNSVITHLNIAENKLGTEGAFSVGEILRKNRVIKHLDVSGNKFTDSDAVHIAKAVEDHQELATLILSHNEFGDLSSGTFEHMIAENGSLHKLDLGWNHFRGPGAKRIAQGLSENVCIRCFCGSWNGFDDEGAIAMASTLEHNSVLEELDISCNRIGPKGYLELIQALNKNDTLEILRVGRNYITDEAATASVEVLTRMEGVRLKQLDLSDVILNDEFEDTLSGLYDSYPELEVVYGYTHSYGKRKMKTYNVVEEALTIIHEYLRMHDMTMAELFSRFDADGSMSVTHDEFKEGLKEAAIPLSEDQVADLILGLDRDGDGEIDFSELVITNQETMG